MNPNKLWFNSVETDTLCRGGANGPAHPSQMYAINKYMSIRSTKRETFLDYGCGSGTTYEAMGVRTRFIDYTGTDIIPKNIEWDKKTFPDATWVVNTEVNKITQPDKSFDVVYSRHVVDHMRSFEDAMDEHCRVAKELVIVILWYSLNDTDEHIIKNIDYSHVPGGKKYPDEYLNSYSRTKVMDYLNNKEGWELVELTEHYGGQDAGSGDVVIVLKAK